MNHKVASYGGVFEVVETHRKRLNEQADRPCGNPNCWRVGSFEDGFCSAQCREMGQEVIEAEPIPAPQPLPKVLVAQKISECEWVVPCQGNSILILTEKDDLLAEKCARLVAMVLNGFGGVE